MTAEREQAYAAAVAAVEESDRRWWDDPQESTAGSTQQDQQRRIRAAVDAVWDLAVAGGRRLYAREDEEACGAEYPGGGQACQLRRGHDTHARKASGGFTGWVTDWEATVEEARAEGRRQAAEAIRMFEPTEAGLARWWEDAARIAEGGAP